MQARENLPIALRQDAEDDAGRSPDVVIRIRGAAAVLGGRLVWHDVSLDVRDGEFIAVLGPNGAGKSTLIKAILGLLPLSEGSIEVLGQPVRRGNDHIGYVPQRRSFDPDVHVRGRDVVRLGLDGSRWGTPLPGLGLIWHDSRDKESRSRVQAVIELVGAESYADRPIGELSGGEQQRLLIAQALVTRPRILLLDEPLDSLDLRNQQEMSGVIRRISEESDTAVLLVAHDVNPLLPYLDRVCYVAQSHMAIGAPDEIITTETLTRLYGAPIEVLRTQSGQLVVVGQPEGVPCAEHHHPSRN
jgi:zinc/manganese transport system ATP-binding protein